MKFGILLATLFASAVVFAQEAPLVDSYDYENQNARVVSAPPMLGVHWAKGVTPPASADSRAVTNARRSANMTYHGGVIMTSANVHPIFWGTSWPSYSGDKISGMNSYYAGWSNS